MEKAHPSDVASYHLLPRLKQLDRWIPFQIRELEERVAKVPVAIDRERGRVYRCSYKNDDNWYTYHQCSEILSEYEALDGLQFVINDSKDSYVVVDFDNCVDPETREIDPAARKYLAKTDTYAELSPSGTGFHLVYQGSVPNQGWSAETDAVDLEVYEKYIITMTENHLTGTPYEAKPSDGVLNQIFTENDIRWRERLYESQEADPQLGTPGVSY